jgi:hypothetical protein
MFENIFSAMQKKWEDEHFTPSELILNMAESMEKNGTPTDHAILVSILAFLDEEVGSSRKREDVFTKK